MNYRRALFGAGVLLIFVPTFPSHAGMRLGISEDGAKSHTKLADTDSAWFFDSSQAGTTVKYLALRVGDARSIKCLDTLDSVWFLDSTETSGSDLSGTPLPAAVRTRPVRNTTELNNALRNSQPGDHIVLANGDYSGFNVTRAGTAAKPVVIRAANILGATITSTCSVNADNIIIYGLDAPISCVVGNNSRAANCRLWRCRFRNNAPDFDAGTKLPGGPNTRIAIRLYNAPDFDGAYCQVGPMSGRGFGFDATRSKRPVWRYSIFRDNNNPNTGNDGEAMHYSFGPPGEVANGLVYRCKFKNWSPGGEGELISVKCSGNTFRQLTVENCVAEAINNRFGKNNIYDAIWTNGSMGIGIHDGCYSEGNQVLGCRVDNPTGPSPGIMVRAGQNPPCSFDIGSQNAAAGECKVSGCIGTVRVGRTYSNSTQPARGTRIRQHTGSIILNLHTGTDSQPDVDETLYEWSPLIWLEDSDVGPMAGVVSKNSSGSRMPIAASLVVFFLLANIPAL